MKCENCEEEHDGQYGSGRFCSSKCARSFSTKDKRGEINKKISIANKGNKHSLEVRKKISEANRNRSPELKKQIGKAVSKYYKDNPEAGLNQSTRMSERVISNETKKKLSEAAIKRNFGGVTQSRWIDYRGRKLGSSYEYKVALSLDKNNIQWDTCSAIPYIDLHGKKRTYTPDLYLIDYDVYLEPKNDFLIENINPNLGFKDLDKIKWCSEQNNIKVIVLDKNQLDWDYIKTKL